MLPNNLPLTAGQLRTAGVTRASLRKHYHRIEYGLYIPVDQLLPETTDSGFTRARRVHPATLVRAHHKACPGHIVTGFGAAAMSGMEVRIAAPAGYGPTEVDVDRIASHGAPPLVTSRPADAVAGVDVVVTDVWTSMGQEHEAAARRVAFEGFTVDEALMAGAAPGSVFLHCLPAHRGEEVSAEVVDGPRSLVWDEAENRRHAQKAVLTWLLERQGSGHE